jgi:hypothetical protein
VAAREGGGRADVMRGWRVGRGFRLAPKRGGRVLQGTAWRVPVAVAAQGAHGVCDSTTIMASQPFYTSKHQVCCMRIYP